MSGDWGWRCGWWDWGWCGCPCGCGWYVWSRSPDGQREGSGDVVGNGGEADTARCACAVWLDDEAGGRVACKGSDADFGRGGGVELLAVPPPTTVERSRFLSLGGAPRTLGGRCGCLEEDGRLLEVGLLNGKPANHS